MNWPAYPKYKDSGVMWLGQVPVGWEVRNPKTLFTQHRESAHAGDRQLTASQKHGVIYQDEYMESQGTRVVQVIEGQAGLKHVSSGDFVISLRSFQGGIEWCANSGKISPAYTVLTPGEEVVERFFIHALKSDGFIQDLRSTSNQLRDGQSLGFDHFAKVSVPVPPASDQDLIAKFLDRETGKIDALIDKQHQLISTLREDRTATITHAVTKGLNPDAEMKDSGVERLGMVPMEWTLQRMSWLFNTISSGTTPSSDRPEYYDGDVNWVTTGELRESIIYGTKKKVTRQALVDHSPLVVYPAGALLIAMYGATIGRLGILGEPACVNQACTVFSGAKRVINSFAFYSLLAAREHLMLLASGGGQPNINQEKLRSLRIAVPPLDEQNLIVSHLELECGKIDALLDESAQAIATLREYRSALITAAVTGKIDVREAV